VVANEMTEVLTVIDISVPRSAPGHRPLLKPSGRAFQTVHNPWPPTVHQPRP
jgi:hypothetical protein